MNRSVEQKVLKFIDSNELIIPGDKILVALSGGPDSVFLLSFLLKYKKKLKINVGAFHLNHKLRGNEADEDEKFCKSFCRKNKIRFYSSERNIKLISKKKNISVEEAGRIIRYEELNRCAEGNSFNKIATAHNIDDHTETVLLNLIKGAGLKGLTGIPVKRENIIRPLLPVSKNEILDYLKRNKINYRTDESNLSSDYERNYLRNEIVQKLKERLNPSLDNSVLKTTSVLNQYYSYLSEQINPQLKLMLDKKGNEVNIKTSLLDSIDIRLRGLFFQELLNKKFKLELSNEKINSILDLQYKQAGRKIELEKNIVALRERSEIIIRQKVSEKIVSIKLKPGVRKKINNKTISITEKVKNRIKLSSNSGIEFVDVDKCSDDFELRNWKAGDRFQPFGMKGTKKISDFLTEQKVPVAERKNKLVLTNSGKIVWVVGYRIDDRFKITNKTKKVFELCFR